MTDDLYERYKEALRTGHVAVLRGQLEEALEAYQLAASIAPARALPHASLGGVYLRLNRVDEALTEYAAAVARAPQDEGALLGQAEALAAVGRFIDAATALDRVAQIQEAAGRLPEATDTLRRALELDEAPERIRRQRALLRQIRMSAGDQAAEHALARALRLREEPSMAAAMPATVDAAAGSTAGAAPEVADGSGVRAAAPFAGYVAQVQQPQPAETDEAVADVVEQGRGPVFVAPEVEPAAFAVAEEPVEAVSVEPEVDAVAEAAAATTEAPEPAAVEIEQPVVADVAYGAESWLPVEAVSREAVAMDEPVFVEAAESEIGPVEAADSRFEDPMATDALEPDVVATYAVDADSVEPAAVEAEPVAVMDDVSTLVAATPLPVVMPQPTADELVAIAEQAEAVGNHIEARRLLVNAAREFAREGRYEAGLDVAHQLLHEYPSDVDVHLVLVELYISRNWETVAAEKLILLGRLADLDDDEETRLRLCAAASQAFPENGRLASLCA